MLKLLLRAAVLLLGLLPALAIAEGNKGAAEGNKGAKDANPVVATIDGQKIRLDDVKTAHGLLPGQYRSVPLDRIYAVLLDRVIDAKLLSAAGRKKNLQNDPDVKRRLGEIEDRLIQNAYLAKQVDPKITEAALKKRYQAFVETLKDNDEVRARHILVRTKKEAEAIIKALAGGADFAKLAAEKSTGPSGSKGGDLGYFGRGDMVKEFVAAVFKLKKGETTKSPVKTQFGWHVIRVEDRRTKKPPTFASMKDKLRDEMSQELVGKLVASLRKVAKIKTFKMDGSPQKAPTAGPGKSK